MKIHFIKSREKRRLLAQLKDQFGITKLPYLLIQSGKEKVRGFSGNLSKEEISLLSRTTNIEIIGLYLFKKEKSGQLRLSLDSPHLLKKQISSNIAKISDNQLEEWIRGRDIEIKLPSGMVVIQHNDDFIGSGISTENKIINHIPKERRLKKK